MDISFVLWLNTQGSRQMYCVSVKEQPTDLVPGGQDRARKVQRTACSGVLGASKENNGKIHVSPAQIKKARNVAGPGL